MGNEFKFFNARFKRISRPDREKILCAMIRINYGTPWDGDLERLKEFFPDCYHARLVVGGLTELAEALTPFADEPTDAGFTADEITLVDEETTTRLNANLPLQEETTTELPSGIGEYTATIH